MPDAAAAQKFAILRDIYALVREQYALIEEERLDDVRALMDRRDALMDGLRDLVEHPEPPPANLVALPSALVESEQDEIALDTVIRGIMELDRKCEALLTAKMAEVGAQVPALRHGRAAASQYRRTAPSGGYVNRVS